MHILLLQGCECKRQRVINLYKLDCNYIIYVIYQTAARLKPTNLK